MAIFWDVASCSLVDIYRPVRGAYYLHHQSDHPTSGFVTLVSIYQTTLLNISQDFVLVRARNLDRIV
jgi:hypothetical protein